MSSLPEFDDPPVAEVVLGIQFRQLFELRGLVLAPLRDRWRPLYPRIEEAPAIPPIVESDSPGMPQFQFNLVQMPTTRQLFLSETGDELIQIQPDRFVVNWRAGDPPVRYPRYGYVRKIFEERFRDFTEFVESENLGEIDITQVEVSYINAIKLADNDTGRIESFLKGWSGTQGHHLGDPQQARLTLTFPIVGIGKAPVRLYVEVSPAKKATGESVVFFTLTIRGNPGGRSVGEAMKFMDEAHEHVVLSFTELTNESMHHAWGRRHDNP